MTNRTIKVENKIETIIFRCFYFLAFYFSVFLWWKSAISNFTRFAHKILNCGRLWGFR